MVVVGLVVVVDLVYRYVYLIQIKYIFILLKICFRKLKKLLGFLEIKTFKSHLEKRPENNFFLLNFKGMNQELKEMQQRFKIEINELTQYYEQKVRLKMICSIK